MGSVPQAYFDFVMHYAPFYYVVPSAVTVDAAAGQKNVAVADGSKFQANFPVQILDDVHSEWNTVASVNGNVVTMQNNLANTYYVTKNGKVEGPDKAFMRGTFAASFAIEFLYEAYSATQFSSERTEIRSRIVELADWLLTQQCTDLARKAYGGFKSSESATDYWSVDAGRAIIALLKAYAVTGTADYLDAAKLAGSIFLYNMQRQPSVLGVHDKYYGGFARSVTIADAWSQQMNVEDLYGLIGLKMLAETYDIVNAATYQAIMTDTVSFLRQGFEQLFLWFDPKPTGDGKWHRVGLGETQVYDDPISFALLGLYTYEGWSVTCQRVYNFVQSIRASAQYPAYNPSVCWSGYIDVSSKFPACPYYDMITSGILSQIRSQHDKPSYALSLQVISKHQSECMYWGPLFVDWNPVAAQKAMANVSWLARLFLNYSEPVTDFTRILDLKGENALLHPVCEAADQVTWNEALDLKAVIALGTAGEVMLEPGHIMEDYVTVYSFLPVRGHDKITRTGIDYEVLTVQLFDLAGDPQFYKSVCRRMITQ